MSVTTRPEINIKNRKLLSIRIDGNLEARDFVTYLDLIEQLAKYRARILFDERDTSEKAGESLIEYSNSMIHAALNLSYQKVQVKSLKYNSPGWVELILYAPIAVAIFGLLKYYIPNNKDKAEIKRTIAETKKIEIENLKAMGISEVVIQEHYEPKLRRISERLEELKPLVEKGLVGDMEIEDIN